MKLESRIRKEFRKCAAPGDTILRIMGGFHRLQLSATHLDGEISKLLFWSGLSFPSLKFSCAGKGISRELALAGACAEAAERISAGLYYTTFERSFRNPGVHRFYVARINDFLNFTYLDGYVCSHQNDLDNPLKIEDILINERYLTQEDLDCIKACDAGQHWVNGFSLTRQTWMKVPIKLCSNWNGTNGLASGNTLEEAIVQGANEIFERFAAISILRNNPILPTIDPTSILNPWIRDVIRCLKEKKIEVMIKDCTLGGLLPVAGVLFINHNIPEELAEHLLIFHGASFDSDEALIRCFLERGQGHTDVDIPLPRSLDKTEDNTEDFLASFVRHSCRKNLSFFKEGPKVLYRRSTGPADCLDEIGEILRICTRLNTDCVVVDFTHPVLAFPTVRILMPGVSDILSYSGKPKPRAYFTGGQDENEQFYDVLSRMIRSFY